MNMEKNHRSKNIEDLTSILHYCLFIPTYMYFTYRASFVIISLFESIDFNLNRLIVFVVSLYFPIVLCIYLYWGFLYKTKIQHKTIQSMFMWFLGLILIPVIVFILLIINLWKLQKLVQELIAGFVK
jgi:predicted neutral ceramidase superfamily lipid hydrolase